MHMVAVCTALGRVIHGCVIVSPDLSVGYGKSSDILILLRESVIRLCSRTIQVGHAARHLVLGLIYYVMRRCCYEIPHATKAKPLMP